MTGKTDQEPKVQVVNKAIRMNIPICGYCEKMILPGECVRLLRVGSALILRHWTH